MIAMRIVRDVARLHLLTISQVKSNCRKAALCRGAHGNSAQAQV
jgi:hypothetical protein